MSGLTVLRGFHPSDIDFISKTWRQSLRGGTSYYQLIDKELFNVIYSSVIEQLLSRPDVWVNVMCLTEDPEIIIGYAVCEMRKGEAFVHWVYVKPAWRKAGIGKSLLPPTPFTATHITRIARLIVMKHPEIRFNPFNL